MEQDKENWRHRPLTKIERRMQADQKKILDFLAEFANVSLACRRAGVSRETFYRWRKNEEFDVEVEVSMLAGKRSLNDLAQHQLIRKIQDGETKAITFHLEHCHEDYNGSAETEDGVVKTGYITQINILPVPDNQYNPDRSIYNIPPSKYPDGIINDSDPDAI